MSQTHRRVTMQHFADWARDGELDVQSKGHHLRWQHGRLPVLFTCRQDVRVMKREGRTMEIAQETVLPCR